MGTPTISRDEEQQLKIRRYRPIRDDGHPDVAGYNKELEQLGKITWHNAPWLFTECYLFR